MFYKFITKKYTFCFSLAVMYVAGYQSFAQEFKSYSQELEGTGLSFTLEAIPGGEFIMGNDKSDHADEKPAHRVKVDPFYMSTYEVTWDLYEPFIYKDFELARSNNGNIPTNVDAVTRPTKPYLDMTFGMGKEGFPAVGMTQYNAIQFCKWLYERTGVFYRLPTEAEWEYACRAGTESTYFFGDESDKLDEYAWYDTNANGKTAKVGQKKPNPFGLYDILGNVAEWTYDQYESDFYSSFDSGVAENPISIATKLYPHSIRGGSFLHSADELTSSKRDFSDPSWKQLDPQIPKSNWWFPEAPFIGLRLVRPMHTPSAEEIDEYYNKLPIKDF